MVGRIGTPAAVAMYGETLDGVGLLPPDEATIGRQHRHCDRNDDDSAASSSSIAAIFRSPLLEVFKLGLVVTLTFAVVWSPYLYSLEAVMEVLSRLAPFERGVYEDYVANFWCTFSVLVK
ncbi:putative dolichyl pyrophosphate Man9GlcNAc2 alpha-1,3-glucosyltransferase [Acorus calamus]|uniref:Alpha-1,3-glucosyltransferase n=1 Tax=Acorus calamus TaxID=4465 RepID=A0AAV9F6R0_ACOCL|nr:putative dolichyl pyrophosphate Man9GlcNAc2 alpha-1,3-glucosyltransferase [Acorus calamus]